MAGEHEGNEAVALVFERESLVGTDATLLDMRHELKPGEEEVGPGSGVDDEKLVISRSGGKGYGCEEAVT